VSAELLDLLVGASGLSGDADEQSLVDEPVGDGRSGGGVVEELAPLLEGQIGGDDGGSALVASVEDLVEQVCTASIEAEVSELVDEDEVGLGPGCEPTGEGVAGLGGDELVDEVCGEGEADALSAQASELSDGVCEMGLADAGGTDEDDVGFVGDEVERGSAVDEVLVDALGVVEVVGVQGREREDVGASQGCFCALLGLCS